MAESIHLKKELFIKAKKKNNRKKIGGPSTNHYVEIKLSSLTMKILNQNKAGVHKRHEVLFAFKCYLWRQI